MHMYSWWFVDVSRCTFLIAESKKKLTHLMMTMFVRKIRQPYSALPNTLYTYIGI